MAKHSEATLARLRELYLKRKSIQNRKKNAGVTAKPLSTKEQEIKRKSLINTLDKVLASPLPEAEQELREEESILDINEAIRAEIDIEKRLAIRKRYLAVVSRLTAITYPDVHACHEENGIKRLALEVIYAACNDARLNSRDADGRRNRAEAILFLMGKSPLQIKTRNAWIRTAGIGVDYFYRKFSLNGRAFNDTLPRSTDDNDDYADL